MRRLYKKITDYRITMDATADAFAKSIDVIYLVVRFSGEYHYGFQTTRTARYLFGKRFLLIERIKEI